MFLHPSVILSTGRGGVPGQVAPQAGTPPLAGTPPGRYTPQAGTLPGHYTPQQVHPPRKVHPRAGRPPRTVHAGIRSTSGRYTSHWNAFLLNLNLNLQQVQL